MEQKKPYEKIIELNSQKMKLEKEINNLKPNAIIQLCEMGYSMDNISIMLKTGKINVFDILHKNKKEIGQVGRKRKNEI